MFRGTFVVRTITLALILGLLGLVFSCAKVTSSGPSTPGGTVNNPPVGVVNDAQGFYVQHVASTNYTYVTHKGSTTFSTPCVAALGELASCYVEGEELDLYMQGIQLQYNVPSTMCEYFEVAPYWYFTYQPGVGPANITVDTDKNGNVGSDPGNTGTVTGPIPTCSFDYTPTSGPNCCLGTFTETDRTYNTTTNSYQTTGTTFSNPWGGNVGTCINGPAVATQPKQATTNLPVPVDFLVSNIGTNNIYTVASPSSFLFGSDIYVANFWDASSFGGGMPPALSTQAGITPVPFYDFICKDRADEYLAEIQLYVRKWGTDSNFQNMATNPAGYNVTGFEAAPWNTHLLDDFKNWDDVGAVFPETNQ
jgi:hypothetical protein